jgi:hypothetical protein
MNDVIEFTSKQSEAFECVRSEKFNFILYGGAIRGGKSYWGLITLLMLCRVFPGSRWCVIRQDSERIRSTTIPTFSKILKKGKLRQSPFEYIHDNGSVILFKSEQYDMDKELNWMKGLEVNGFLFEEINECQEATLNKAFERAGAWNIKGLKRQPKPIILATCNPTNNWVKSRIYDKWKSGDLPTTWNYIPAKITDNPYLSQDYIDSLKNLPIYDYMVFVDGDWDVQLKTGGEFWKGFELEKHVKTLEFNRNAPFHVSIDENVNPYLTLSIWQIDGKKIRQVHEMPCVDPNNTASRAGKAFSNWLTSIGNYNPVFVYGDTSTLSGNTIDDDKKTFLDKFISELEKHHKSNRRMFSKNPGVAISGDFINAIYTDNYGGLSIEISENCKTSIADYIAVKEDADGSMAKPKITDPKTKVRYELHGHFSDAKRYFICKAFEVEFNNYKNRFNEEFLIGKRKSYVR